VTILIQLIAQQGCVLSWLKRFPEPIMLLDSKELGDLAGRRRSYPLASKFAKRRQTATHCLIDGADHGRSVMNARIGVSQALMSAPRAQF
jgi:hypothetical protein